MSPMPAQDAAARDRLALRGAARRVAASWVRFCSISKADSRSIAVSYLPLTGLLSMIALRSSGVTGPTRADGGQIMHRSTIDGVPLPSRNDTSASPFPSSVITVAVSSLGFGRKVSAAARTAFWSRGVKARSACCTRLPSCASDLVRHVERVLRDEIDADALGADQPHHLLDLVEQRLGRVGEQQMRLVEEEHELRLVADRRPRAAPRTARTAARAGTSRRAAGSASACRRRAD